MHDRSLSWIVTGTSIKSGGVKKYFYDISKFAIRILDETIKKAIEKGCNFYFLNLHLPIFLRIKEDVHMVLSYF